MSLKEELAVVVGTCLLVALFASVAVGLGLFSGVASVPFATLSMYAAFFVFAPTFTIIGLVMYGLFRLSQGGGGSGGVTRR